jgi:hypothetical protein
MTYEEAIRQLIAKDVERWGQGERQASERLNRKNCPTIGLALNKLAHYDVENINDALAKEAKRVMTAADLRVLKRGG